MFRRILFGLLGAFVLLLMLVFVVEPMTWRWRVRRESLATLTAAKTANDIQKAVGSLGVCIRMRDGSWIAIRYRDTHAFQISSLAIARDSGGGWFESDHHFCGALAAYRHIGEVRAELAKLGETDTNLVSSTQSGAFVALNAMGLAESLEDGRKQLLKIGFKPMK